MGHQQTLSLIGSKWIFVLYGGHIHEQSQIIQKALLIGGPVEKALMKEMTLFQSMKVMSLQKESLVRTN